MPIASPACLHFIGTSSLNLAARGLITKANHRSRGGTSISQATGQLNLKQENELFQRGLTGPLSCTFTSLLRLPSNRIALSAVKRCVVLLFSCPAVIQCSDYKVHMQDGLSKRKGKVGYFRWQMATVSTLCSSFPSATAEISQSGLRRGGGGKFRIKSTPNEPPPQNSLQSASNAICFMSSHGRASNDWQRLSTREPPHQPLLCSAPRILQAQKGISVCNINPVCGLAGPGINRYHLDSLEFCPCQVNKVDLPPCDKSCDESQQMILILSIEQTNNSATLFL